MSRLYLRLHINAKTERRILTIFKDLKVSFMGDFYEITNGRSPSVVVIMPSYRHAPNVIDVKDYGELIRRVMQHIPRLPQPKTKQIRSLFTQARFNLSTNDMRLARQIGIL